MIQIEVPFGEKMLREVPCDDKGVEGLLARGISEMTDTDRTHRMSIRG
jgi:hypothetical protein